eukprot:TRINITY_DN20194_c0_g3_i1.p1 TRINITY_DN20194_c0_g3~~TRINITY_DN20194_c0_g3_i1.p1  ORF type:complete len:374 (+),score=69.87 TRINITY_DN20194_c0_g3_i1:62-1183(+)
MASRGHAGQHSAAMLLARTYMALTAAVAAGGALPQVPLQAWQVGGYEVLRGRETAVTAQPFFVLPQQVTGNVVASALQATEELVFGDHNDEADWLPAYEVYVMEGGRPVQGAAPPAFIEAVAALGRATLPFVREAYGCADCFPCTAFARRYLPSERVSIPAHFDVTAFATVILPLSPAENYTGGFFVQPTAHIGSRLFVPLQVGDVAVHDFTLNHGIEVKSGGRFSLVIWVSETEAACRGSATPWHAERALNGDAVAQHILGMMYGQGNGAPKDDVKALQWTLRAAEAGLANAQFSAGTMYFEGQGTAMNETRALYWYEQSAKQGDASSQLILAKMYSEGVGTVVDQERAAYWYRLGREQEGAALMGPPRWSR